MQSISTPACHPERRHYAHGLCPQCYDSLWRRTSPTYLEKERKRNRKRMESVQYRARMVQYSFAWKLRTKFGISVKQYNDLLTSQNGVCAICKKSQRSRKLAIDHNHITGKVRGLLCNTCNRAIGYLHEDITLMKAAIKYLGEDI